MYLFSSLKLPLAILSDDCAEYCLSSGNRFSFMYFRVFNVICEKHKVLNSIIVSDSVNMMNNFFDSKKSSNMLFHYKSMLRNIQLVMMRMIWSVLMDISVTLSKENNLMLIATNFGAVFSSIGKKPMRLHRKWLATMNTGLVYCCRERFSHTSPRASLLMLATANKFFIAYWTDLLVLAWHKFLSVVRYILLFINIPYIKTESR